MPGMPRPAGHRGRDRPAAGLLAGSLEMINFGPKHAASAGCWAGNLDVRIATVTLRRTKEEERAVRPPDRRQAQRADSCLSACIPFGGVAMIDAPGALHQDHPASLRPDVESFWSRADRIDPAFNRAIARLSRGSGMPGTSRHERTASPGSPVRRACSVSHWR
jgi:hypothetical protein